jgi:hypothetical protein
MAKKVQFDYKQFLLEKGEKVGLVVAGALAAIFIVLGLMFGMSRGSPLAPLQKNARDLVQRVQASKPPDGKIVPPPPPQFVKDRDPDTTSFWEWVTRVNMEDNKKRNPTVSDLELFTTKDGVIRPNYQVDIVRAPIRAVQYSIGGKLYVLTAAADTNPNGESSQKAERLLPKRLVVVNAVFPWKRQLAAYRRALRIQEKPEEKDPNRPSPATPEVFFEIPGFFLYRRTTLPDGRVQLHPTDQEPKNEWEILQDDKTAAEKASKTDREDNRYRMLIAGAAQIEPVDENLAEYAHSGTVMPLPALAGTAKYKPVHGLAGIPDAEPAPKDEGAKDLRPGPARPPGPGGGDKQTIKPIDWAELEDTPTQAWLSGEAVNVFDPSGRFGKDGSGQARKQGAPAEMGEAAAGRMQPKGRRGGLKPGRKKGKKGADKKDYDNALFRFVDVDVKPGYTYDYAIVIRMVNPNYGKPNEVADERWADAKELYSNYNIIPQVHIPYDTAFYAVDERQLQPEFMRYAMAGADKRDATPFTGAAVQVQRWVEQVPNQERAAGFPLGLWLMAERLLVRRGEPIGREVRLPVPRWDAAAERFDLVGKPGTARSKSTYPRVDFTVRHGDASPPAILVDYEGGLQDAWVGKKKMSDRSAVRLLVLTPEGKLAVRSSLTDSDVDNPRGKERKERYEEVKEMLDKLKESKKPKRKGKLGGFGTP